MISHILNHKDKAVYLLCIMLQMVLYLFCARNIRITGDGIFTYTLSNNPYEHLFISSAIEHFPNTNGWMDADILREQYVTTENNRFNYGMTYYHQLSDVHPIFYYYLVHTVCSLFPEQFSGMFALSINIAFMMGIDILLWFIGKKYIKGHSLVLLIYTTLTAWIFSLVMYPRMYVMLSFFCLLHLYLHLQMVEKSMWTKADLWLMILCITMGELTHYYFYVYAAGVSLLTCLILIYRKKFYKLLNYIAAGIMGVCIGLIVYPWSMKHIILNSSGKHKVLPTWDYEWLKSGLHFWWKAFFNGSLWIVLLIAGCALALFVMGGYKSGRKSLIFLLVGSNIIYSLAISMLDGFAFHYLSPIAVPMCICAVMLIITGTELVLSKRKKISVVLSGILIILCLNPIGLYTNIESITAGGLRYNNFHKIAERYQADDCLYIEGWQDNLLGDLWLEFGEYDEFKKVSCDKFLEDNILTADYSEGRKTESDVIIVYIPSNYELNQKDVELLMEYSGFKVYKWMAV